MGKIESGAPKNPIGRHVQESSGRKMATTNSQKPVRMEYTHTTSVKTTSLGLAHLVIKHSRSSWFHKKAVALVGLIGLIYLFIYDFIYGFTFYASRVKDDTMLMCVCVSPSGCFTSDTDYLLPKKTYWGCLTSL
jgi:hypothetical protein